MKSKLFLFSALFCFMGLTAFADDAPKIEVFGEYSYLRFNPTLPGIQNRSFNGGGGGVTFNLNNYFGIKAELMGYGSTNYTIPAGTTIPGVTPPAVTTAPITTQGNMFTYLFGPQVTYRTSKFNAFGELLFGGSNSNGYANVAEAFNGVGANIAGGTQHPFTMAFGGGLDIKVAKNIAIRPVEIDWVVTRYTNPITLTNNQNCFRYVAGVVFYLGGK
ncbi:MAG: hypothetical protein U0V70_08030 [Terriglobia bacterium]